MKNWLLKTEPDVYGWKDLVAEGKTTWDGIKGGLAQKNLGKMQPGDHVFIYHTGREKRIIGTARVEAGPYVDPNQPGSRLLVVDVVPLAPLNRPVTLQELKQQAEPRDSVTSAELWKGWELLRIPRLSVVPVSEEQWKAVLELAEK